MSEKTDVVVIGAGVIGLAIAARFAQQGREVVVVESENAIGTVTSSRNSEVIHAGIYYAKDSLKARLCVRGRELLYQYGESHGVTCKPIGKLIVATSDDQLDALSALQQKGIDNGVEDLQLISGTEAAAMEPNLHAVAALLSPRTGLVDSHALMLALQGDIENAGSLVVLNSPVTSGRVLDDNRIELNIGGDAPMDLNCQLVINAAGHGAWAVARSITGIASDRIPPHHLAKGNYFMLSGKAPFSRLIYPLPDAASLGCHYTLDLGGQGRFGPDVEWVNDMDYQVDPARAEAFYTSIRNYWPAIPDGALSPGYAGIRPKIQSAGEEARDFVIQGPGLGVGESGALGLIALYGIESPGLTSALAIAEMVASMID